MRSISFVPGDVLIASLPERYPQGHEQEGKRPVVVVGLPERLGVQRFPIISIIPFTDLIDGKTHTIKTWVSAAPDLYPVFSKGTASLRKDCVALLDQLQAIDCTRVQSYCGRLTPVEYEPILKGIQIIYGVCVTHPATILPQ